MNGAPHKIFKTPEGLELPLLNLKGKDYLQVAHRVQWFRSKHPTWRIMTEFVQVSDESATAKATILDDQNNILATSHKYEDSKGFADYREKAETGAVGRALALCGFGTQFASEFEEGERVADSPLQARRLTPVPQAPANGGQVGDAGSYTFTFGKHTGVPLRQLAPGVLRGYQKYLLEQANKDKKPLSPKAQEAVQKIEEFLRASPPPPVESGRFSHSDEPPSYMDEEPY